MPTTVNGVGTGYFGKSNVTARAGTCQSCDTHGTLLSYDTRYCVVVLFLPVLPMGRKRIIDYCATCTRHGVIDSDQFAAIRRREIARAHDAFAAEATAKNALELHAIMLAFGDPKAATQFRQRQRDAFARNTEYLICLAGQLEDVQQLDKALHLYDAAYQVDPKHPIARLGAGQLAIRDGRSADARKMLSFLEEPGASQRFSLEPLISLAQLYHRAGQHELALQLLSNMLQESPALGQQYPVRQLIKSAEKQAGGVHGLLPPLESSLLGRLSRIGPGYPPWQKFALAGGFAMLLLAMFLVMLPSLYQRKHQLHVVNALPKPVQVQVDDQPPVSVTGLAVLTVTDGKHQIIVSGAVDEVHDIDVTSDRFLESSSAPLWVLNPGAVAVFIESKITYSSNPQPPEEKVILGESFFHREQVDYPFTIAPFQLEVSSRTKETEKVQLIWKQDGGLDLLTEVLQIDEQAALKFAETALLRSPERDDLLSAYAGLALELKQPDRLQKFLRAGVNRSAAGNAAQHLTWHLLHVGLAETKGNTESLIQEYDQLLAKQPHDGTLLMIRARIEPDFFRQTEMLRQAAIMAPDLAQVHFFLAQQEAAMANWDAAFQHLAVAEQRGFEPELVDPLRQSIYLATGNADRLVDFCRQQLADEPRSIDKLIDLTEALLVAGREAEINPAIVTWAASMASIEIDDRLSWVRGMASYMAGDSKVAARLCKRADPELATELLVHLLLLQGQPAQASELAKGSLESANGTTMLAISAGWMQAGDFAEAHAWRDRACAIWTDADPEFESLTRLLKADEPVPPPTIAMLSLEPQDKAMILATMGLQYPELAHLYFPWAEQFNIRRIPPYHQIKKIIHIPAAGEATDE